MSLSLHIGTAVFYPTSPIVAAGLIRWAASRSVDLFGPSPVVRLFHGTREVLTRPLLSLANR